MAEMYDVIAIGGGTAGLVTASGCARLGRKVALIEKALLGGDCLWTGCVPTKALVSSAKLAYMMRTAANFGIAPVEPVIEPRKVMEAMRRDRKSISRHDDPEKFRKLGIDVIFGDAHFLSPHSIEVGGRVLEAKDIVIATGSRTNVPPVEGLASAGYVDHASFLDRDVFPKSVIVLGGGYIGLEFAQILRRFGATVTVVEMFDEIIPREDPDVIRLVRARLEAEGIEIRTGWKAKSARAENGERLLDIEHKAGERAVVTAEEIFVASGRRGNIESLNLETAGVKTDKSYVIVDSYLATNVPNIWACGDVTGGLQFTHVAAYEAMKLVRNILFPGKSRVDYSDMPWALYTDPEIARVGLTEPEAIAKFGKQRVRTYKVEMTEVDRAVVDRATAGFLKIVATDKGVIVGAHAACSHASTMIEELVLAKKKGVKVGELAQLVSPYPSFPDAVQKAAAGYYQNLGTSWMGTLAKRVAAWSQ